MVEKSLEEAVYRKEDIEAFLDGIDCEGFDYYLTDYIRGDEFDGTGLGWAIEKYRAASAGLKQEIATIMDALGIEEDYQ